MAELTGAAPAPGRVGRNVPLATLVGLGLLGLVVVALFVRKEAFVVLTVLAIGAALWELAQAFTRRDIQLPLLPLLVGSVGILVSAFEAGSEALLVSFVLTVGGVVVWRVLDGPGQPALRDAAAGTFAAAYLPFLGGFVMLMLSEADGPKRVLLFILMVVANDTGGFIAGVLAGRHPLARSVSPSKTWEGFAGSLLLAMGIGAAGMHWLFSTNPWLGVVIGAGTVVIATLGDLSESLLKRDLQLKDMGTLLPGHGGLLDRLDSLLIAAPVVYLALLLTLPVGD